MTYRPTGLYQLRLWFTEITTPSAHGPTMEYQPFMNQSQIKPSDRLLLDWAQQHHQWTQWLSAEQTAYALGQVTASRALPSLIEFVSTAALLDSRIHLRQYLDHNLVDAITATLIKNAPSLQWKQVDESAYVYVVGAGVAACVDSASGDEILYLRYSNQIAEAITHAQNETELPRSLLGLQSNLHDCLDLLLASARSLTLKQLT